MFRRRRLCAIFLIGIFVKDRIGLLTILKHLSKIDIKGF